MRTKTKRRKLHAAINALEPETLAGIVRQNFPSAKGNRIDELAKALISKAHRRVSPRKSQRG